MSKTNLLRSVSMAFALVISSTGCGAIFERETSGEYVEKATITTKGKASIVNELGLKQTGVEPMQNVVQLSGFVDPPRTRIGAGEIARNTSGVQDVRSNLVVRRQQGRRVL